MGRIGMEKKSSELASKYGMASGEATKISIW